MARSGTNTTAIDPVSRAHRTRFMATALGWIALVTVAQVALVWWATPRVPDTVASHWGPSGAADRSSSWTSLTTGTLVVWLVIAAGVSVPAFTGRRSARRPVRAMTAAVLGFGGVFAAGLLALTVWANLDVSTWTQARSLSWQVLLVIVAAGLAGAAGYLVGNRGPDEPPSPVDRPAPTSAVRLSPGERTVWISSVSNRFLVALGAILAALSAALMIATMFGVPSWMWSVAGAMDLAAVLSLATGTIRVQVDETGVAIAYGPWRWPRQRITLESIERAWTEDRRPSQLGGWGYRGLPGRMTLMIRGGECLVLRRTSGAELGISIDGADRGAALLEALLEQRTDALNRRGGC